MPIELDQAIEAAENLTKLQIEQSSSDESYQNQLHILWAGELYQEVSRNINNCVKASIQRCDYEAALPNPLLTTIIMFKEKCVTKEFVDIQYPKPSEEVENKIKENEEEGTAMEEQAYTSVGRDLEVFYKRIKRGEITKETLPDAGVPLRSCIRYDVFSGRSNPYPDVLEDKMYLKLFCLLGRDERKKLDREDKKFYETFIYYNPDVKRDEWEKTESKHLKYAMYRARRRTSFLDTFTT